MKKAVLYGTVVVACAVAPLLAQTTTQPKNPPSQPRTEPRTQSQQRETHTMAPDEHFVRDVAADGLAEVELGKLAADKASSSKVKDFASKMVADHSKANDELKSIAQGKKLTLPTEVSAKRKATRDHLSKQSGEAFDRAFMAEMVRDHRQAVSAFKRESTTGHDPDFKAWAAKTLPTLEDHLKQAQVTNSSVVGTSGVSKPAPKDTGTTGRSKVPAPAPAPRTPPKQ